ncbi:MAG: nitroreductase family protein [Bacteroidales bacterium]|nr:nitroreductase family protein [Bacteroidales bacterium]
MSRKKSLLHRLSDISKIHHRAAFTDVEKHTAPQKSDFLRLASERYSCRAFTEAPVSDKHLSSILEAARLAPTAQDRQPVHIWVFKSAEALERIKQVTRYSYDAPLVILVGCYPAKAWVRAADGKNGAEVDAAIVGTHIMMETAALGLGSTWVGSFDPAKLAELFPETAGCVPVALFPIGHPKAKPSENHSKRKSIEELVSEI